MSKPTGNRRGRPRTYRSRLLVAFGGMMSREQRQEVWTVLQAYAEHPEETDALDRIDDAWSTYSANQAIRDAMKGAADERDDLVCIADDCDEVGYRARNQLDAGNSGPRLWFRLQTFPPFSEPHVAVLRGVDESLARDERLQTLLMRTAISDAERITLVKDLLNLAADCRAVAARSMTNSTPGKKRRTKPLLAARNELVDVLKELPEKCAFTRCNQTARAYFVRDVLRALGIRAPQNVL